ncbi:hypothetical protein GZL_07954 [Streptomyces sp. 769]|nr:hypothetical protein GZL_07954 [Streptomyces sp. 769]
MTATSYAEAPGTGTQFGLVGSAGAVTVSSGMMGVMTQTRKADGA